MTPAHPARRRGTRRIWEEQTGAVAVLVALLLPVLVGMSALAVDGSRLYLEQRRLQQAADAAAYAAADVCRFRTAGCENESSATDAALRMAKANLPPERFGAVLAEADVTYGTWKDGSFDPAGSDANAVRVVTRRTVDLTLAAIWQDVATVNAEAVAGLSVPPSPLCFLATGGPITFESGSNTTMSGCGGGTPGTVVFGSGAGGSKSGGGVGLDADFVASAEPIDPSGFKGDTVLSGELPADTFRDPFEGAVDAPRSGCTTWTEGTVIEDNTCYTADDGLTIDKGSFKGDKGNGNGEGRENAGNDEKDEDDEDEEGDEDNEGEGGDEGEGKKSKNGNGASGVTFFVSGGPIVVKNGTKNVNLSAPNNPNDPRKDLLFVHEPGTKSGDDAVTFGSGSAGDLEGVVYAPDSKVRFDNGSAFDSGCMRMVAGSLTFASGSKTGSDCGPVERLADDFRLAPRLLK